MNLRLPMTIGFLLIAAMTAMSVWGWLALAAAAQLATHWGFDGRVNGYMSKETGLVLLPAIALAITLFIALIPRIEPRREHLAQSRKAFFVFWIGALGVLALSHGMIVLSAMGYAIDIPGTLLIAVAVMLAAGGNYLGKVRSNFFLGIRTPWTLSSELSWEKSHRLLGRLFVISALVTLAVRFAIGVEAGYLAFAATVTASAVVAIVSSYVYWKQDPERGAA
jgi:uncharacterized membrane protein